MDYRVYARDVILEWNYIHSAETKSVIMPVGWETHSSPELGASAQELINDRVLEDCDLLIGIFWTRLGTPTKNAKSGTAEEIQRHVNAGKPAMVYFSTAPVAPDLLDPNQYSELVEFRKWCESIGLVERLDNPTDFQQKLRRQLQIALSKNDYLKRIIQNARALNDADGRESGRSTPTDPMAELASGLSEEARILLLEGAADKNGTILLYRTYGGTSIGTNGKTLGEPADKRSVAKWTFALEQLVQADLVRPQGSKGQIFNVAELGYQLADYLNDGDDR